MKRLVLIFLSAALLMPTASFAQDDPDPEEFTPVGYEFCGWRDYTNGGWALEWSEDLSGAGTVAFARDMTCSSARRNVTRMKSTRTPRYRPLRAGYKCTELRSAHEFSEVRCVKRGSQATFRYQTGA